jgi:ribonuclease HII
MPSPKSSKSVRSSSAQATKAAAPPRQLDLLWSAASLGLLAGVDEAGRGPLAGPVVAAAVILDDEQPIVGLADSKKLSPRTRDRLYDEIRAKALCCCIAEATVEEIDEINILQATMLAMRRAVEGLRLKPAMVQVDGNRIPVLTVPAQAIVGGDDLVQAISAASILAKVHRDRLCARLHEAYPQYGFDGHKGYATIEHLTALRTHGASPVHRRSFAPVRIALDMMAVGEAVSTGASLAFSAASSEADVTPIALSRTG